MNTRGQRIAGLHVLIDDDPRWPHGSAAQAEAACAGSAAVIQLRAKHSSDRVVLELAREIRRWTRAVGALFFVNDRFDLALLCEADGVHLGQEDLAPERIPPVARARLLVGRSTHTLEEVRCAVVAGADYVAFGPVFETTSKATSHVPCGIAALAAAVYAAAPQPVIAIGGIDAERAAAAARAGAAGAAVISAVAEAQNPQAAVRALAQALSAAHPM